MLGERSRNANEETVSDPTKKYPVVNLFGLDVRVAPAEDIQRDGMPVVCVRAANAAQPWDVNYVPGTRNGFICADCGADCILAPSGQQVVAAGKNPVICMECFIARQKAALA
jgi:hypothetical protein